jgi:hypothetical protein
MWYNKDEVVYIYRLFLAGIIPYIPIFNWIFPTPITELSLFPILLYLSIFVCVFLYYFPGKMVRVLQLLDILMCLMLLFGEGLPVEKASYFTKPLGLSAKELDFDNDGFLTVDEWILELTGEHWKTPLQLDLEALAKEREEFELEKDRFLYEKKLFEKQKTRYSYVKATLKNDIGEHKRELSKLNQSKKTFVFTNIVFQCPNLKYLNQLF